MHSIGSAISRYVPQLPEPQHSQPHVVQSQVPFSQQPQHSQSGQLAGQLPSRAGTMDAKPSVAQSKKPFMRKLPVMGLETESITPRHDACPTSSWQQQVSAGVSGAQQDRPHVSAGSTHGHSHA